MGLSQRLAAAGLPGHQRADNYGFCREARRIAEKYLRVVIKNFQETGELWEKYNVVDGSIQVKNEYAMPAMMGWTAGVFVFCADFLGDQGIG